MGLKDWLCKLLGCPTGLPPITKTAESPVVECSDWPNAAAVVIPTEVKAVWGIQVGDRLVWEMRTTPTETQITLSVLRGPFELG